MKLFNNKILIVDDEIKIVKVIEDYLKSENYITVKAYNGLNALTVFKEQLPKIVILDIMLPDIMGYDVCKKIKELNKDVYIIMLSAKKEEDNVLEGFEVGADDYIRKPFSVKELVFKIKKISQIKKEINLEIDENLMEINYNDNTVVLTKSEFKLFLLLYKNKNRIFTREEIVEYIALDNYEIIDRIVDTYIKNIRKKIDKNIIKTVHGVGYKYGGTYEV